MKKSELKQIIKEVVQAIINEKEASANKIEKREKNVIAKQLASIPLLQGNGRVSGPEKAIMYVTKALDAAGFQLDMVQYDMFRGDSGTKLLPYSRQPTTPNEDGVEIENSRISFSWFRTDRPTGDSLDKKFEVTVYVT